MVPVAVQFHQIPGVSGIIDVSGFDSTGLGRLQKCVRVSGALSLSIDNTAVGGSILPAVTRFIFTVFHQPLNHHHFLLEVAHIIGNILIYKILDGVFHLRTLVSSHHSVISGFKIICPIADGGIRIVIPHRIAVTGAAGTTGTSGSARTAGTSGTTDTKAR